MSRGVNKTIHIGNLGDDPELRYTGSGTAVCNMSLAINENYKDESGDIVEKTEWVDIVAWGRLAEICNEYLSKGSRAYFEGKLQTRSWEDNDGNTRYSTEVKAEEMMFLDSQGSGSQDNRSPQGQQNQQQKPQQTSGSAQEQEPFEPDDSLPF